VRATTPLLAKPLRGPVYLRSSDDRLPNLVAALRGEFDVDLPGRIDAVNGRIRASFSGLPDAPVSRFVLSLPGGERGLLVNSANLCEAPQRARISALGHNGTALRRGIRIDVPACAPLRRGHRG
jgi:hypothetical protein